MNWILRSTIAVGLALAASTVASAQSCRPVPLETSRIKGEVLKLFDLQGQLQDRVAKSALSKVFNVTDCGDATFVMIERAGTSYFIRKSDLTMPTFDTGCDCPGTSIREKILGAPGAADPKFCPAEECRNR